MRRLGTRRPRLHPRALRARGGFTPARALRQWYMVQAPVTDLSSFRTELKQRDLDNFGLFRQGPFEVLDHEDLLRPVAYALHGFAWGYEQALWLERRALLLRDETGFIPWRELRARAKRDFDADLWVLYHPWQLLWAGELVRGLEPSTPLGSLSDGLDWYFEARALLASAPSPTPRLALQGGAAATRRRELLLLRVQNVFLPSVRGGRYLASPIAGLAEDTADWTHQRQRDFNAAYEARALNTDRDELEAAVTHFTVRAHTLDSNRDIFVLLDAVKRGRRDRLRGAARQAWDFYDAARVLRRFHHELTGDWLPDVDELFDLGGGEYKVRLYGTKQPAHDRSALPALLDDYGLYPYRVELIGEGDSELAALEEILLYAYGLEFSRLGISTTDLGGADVHQAARRLFSSLRRYTNYFLLVMDNEGAAREVVDELLRSGIIEDIPDERRQQAVREALADVRSQTFADSAARSAALRQARARAQELDQEPGEAPEHVLWKENLEADNFTLDEMCAVLDGLAADRSLAGWHMSPATVQAALDRGDESRAVASVMVELAEKAEPSFRVRKQELVRALARHAVDHPVSGGRQRPILELAEHLVRLTIADRQVAGRLRTGPPARPGDG